MSDTPSDKTPEPPATYPGGFKAIVEHMNRRRDPLAFAEGEALPPADVDLAPMLVRRVLSPEEKNLPRFKDRSSHLNKVVALQNEFAGELELCWLNGLLIAHLRKSDQPAHTMDLFVRLWREHSDVLISQLNPRWLVSSITTFGDHGQTEAQRSVGAAMTVLFGMMKLYESERLYSGTRPEQEFKLKRLINAPLALEMDRYSMTAGGLDLNLLGRLWEDAAADPVVTDLARHLLEMLIDDPRTVFRRLNTLKGRFQRQVEKAPPIEVKAAPTSAKESGPLPPVHVPVPASAVVTSAGKLRWGIVSTIKAPARQIVEFAAYHLNMGADRLHLYLDTVNPDAKAVLKPHPKIDVTVCTPAYWKSMKWHRPDAHQLRQAFNASRAYEHTDVHWLAHIDVDEFLLPQTDIRPFLAAQSDQIAALSMEPVEQLANPDRGEPTHFKRTNRYVGLPKKTLEDLYPIFGMHLTGGFISHTTGKTFARTGLGPIRFGVHGLRVKDAQIENRLRTSEVMIGHRHAPDWDSFLAHLPYRQEKGSYRKKDADGMRLEDVLKVLMEEDGTEGLEALFDEVCTARPELIEGLKSNGMHVERDLELSATARRIFGSAYDDLP